MTSTDEIYILLYDKRTKRIHSHLQGYTTSFCYLKFHSSILKHSRYFIELFSCPKAFYMVYQAGTVPTLYIHKYT